MLPRAKILFPVNFSGSCKSMASYVKRAAGITNSSVTLVHVVDPTELDFVEEFALAVRTEQDSLRDHRARPADMLQNFLTYEIPAASIPRVLLVGDPATEIARYASAEHF